MTPARLMLYVLVPLLVANSAAWAYYAHNVWMAMFWPALGIATALLDKWMEAA